MLSCCPSGVASSAAAEGVGVVRWVCGDVTAGAACAVRVGGSVSSGEL